MTETGKPEIMLYTYRPQRGIPLLVHQLLPGEDRRAVLIVREFLNSLPATLRPACPPLGMSGRVCEFHNRRLLAASGRPAQRESGTLGASRSTRPATRQSRMRAIADACTVFVDPERIRMRILFAAALMHLNQEISGLYDEQRDLQQGRTDYPEHQLTPEFSSGTATGQHFLGKNAAGGEERVRRIQTAFKYPERAPKKRLVAREGSQSCHGKRSIRMIGAEQLFLDRERAAVEALCRGRIAFRSFERGEIVQVRGNLIMLVAIESSEYPQGPLIHRT
jgi:hypothetical protein